MKRSAFISSLMATGALSASAFVTSAQPVRHLPRKWKIPPHLKPGDVIGITCPSGFALAEDVAPAIQYLQNWGLQVVVGKTVGKKDHTFGGTDQERAEDFQELINRTDVKAILCAHGDMGRFELLISSIFLRLQNIPNG